MLSLVMIYILQMTLAVDLVLQEYSKHCMLTSRDELSGMMVKVVNSAMQHDLQCCFSMFGDILSCPSFSCLICFMHRVSTQPSDSRTICCLVSCCYHTCVS